ncbi:DUF2207 domain-containing protein [Candidatus Chromulinivorax destructor]|uniref:DUF2207 domain-containing protein n=1 Tax=Candidatus Chromulinivorax destructor TaxID=2066483 RepID=A0A345ZBA9_9BACT|nr:DUF2207 domain-containing protein [Candidatus Chromulinivorax destructor]AXK60576.1 hypothetical protein C0J27_02350 [Candidatus Chromulinivorax destructor]
MLSCRALILFLVTCTFVDAIERITSFKSDIIVHDDATLTVQECIECISENEKIVHGLVREFPTKYYDSYGIKHNVDFNIQSITHNGYLTTYTTERILNGVKIYIGDKNIKIPMGRHTYVITYKTARQLGFFMNHDELYWNVTGCGWRLPIDKAQATVFLPYNILADTISVQAYTGYDGQQGENYDYRIQGNSIDFSTINGLHPFQGLTIVVTFPKGFVKEPSWNQKIYWMLSDNIILLVIGILLLFLLYLLLLAVITLKHKNKPGLVIPLYYPPVDMTPSSIGFMTNMKFNPLLLSADIIDLAVHNFITITYNAPKLFASGTYTLKRKESLDNLRVSTKINTYHLSLLVALFGKKEKLIISKEYNPKIAKALKVCQKNIAPHHNAYITTLTVISWRSVLTCLALVGIVFLFFYDSMSLVEDIVPTIVLMFFFKIFTDGPFKIYTAAGRKKQDAIDGFKQYLMVSEVERINLIGTPPIRTPELYEKYLPYAIALGIEKQWTAQFSSLFKKIGKQGEANYMPVWYRGRMFKANHFGSNFTQGFSRAISASSTAPGKASGSNGQGRSGGGGGGGGGGGW